MGRGFTWKSDNLEEDKRLAQQGWEFAQKMLASGKYDLVVLDEFTYLLHYHMVELASCLEVLQNRNDQQHVVITGRYAPVALIDCADLVTEMKVIKHPLASGVKAQLGIEY